MDELLAESGIDFLVQIRIGERAVSVLGERGGHMTMIDQDRLKKAKNVELMERIYDLAMEIREEIRKSNLSFNHVRVREDGV